MLVAQILVPVAIGLAVVVGVVLGMRAGASTNASAAMKQAGTTAMEAFEAFLGRLYLLVFGGALVLALATGGAVGGIERDLERGALAGAAVIVGALGGSIAGIAGSAFAVRTGIGAAAAAQRGANAAALASVRGSAAGVLLAAGLGVAAVAGLFAAYSSILGNDMEESALLTVPVVLGAAWAAFVGRSAGALAAAGTELAAERLRDLPEHDPRNPGVAAAMLGRAAGAAGGALELYGVSVLGTAAGLVLGGLLTGITGDDGWVLLPLGLAAAGALAVAVTALLARVVRGAAAGLVIATVLSIVGSAGLAFAFVEEEWWWFAAAAGLGNIGALAMALAGRLAGPRHARIDDDAGSAMVLWLASGMRGAAFTALVLAAIVAGAWALGEQGAIRDFGAERAGMYGVALAALGMLMPAGYVFAAHGATGLARNAQELAVIAFDVAPETKDAARRGRETLTAGAPGVGALTGGFALVAMVAGLLALLQVVRVEIADEAVDDPGRYARMLQGMGAAPAGIDIEAAITHGVTRYRGLLDDAGTAVSDDDDFGDREISRLILADRAETASRVRELVAAGKAGASDLRDLEASAWPLPRVLPIPLTRGPVMAGVLGGAALVGLMAGSALRARRTAAEKLATEVRRQFIDTPGVSSGEVRADYARAGDAATKGVLGRVLFGAVLAGLATIVAGVGLRWSYGGEGNEGWWALSGLVVSVAIGGSLLALVASTARAAVESLRTRSGVAEPIPADGEDEMAGPNERAVEASPATLSDEAMFGGAGEMVVSGALLAMAVALVVAPFTIG